MRRAAASLQRVGLLCLLALLATAPGVAQGASSTRWAQASINFNRGAGLLPAATLDRAAAPMSRAAFADALASLDAYRAAESGEDPLLTAEVVGAVLSDVPRESTAARAVALGWMSPVAGAFAGAAPITGDEAARGIVGAMGLRQSTAAFAERLRAEVPGVSTNYYLRAAQVYVRAMDMRYNHLQGSERLEVGPTDAMSTAHVAYMLHRGATTSSWRLDSLEEYEQFDIPALGPNQRTVLGTAVSMLGQPYVWAGETELMQPEGHGGFDCSGFVWRTVLNSGLPAGRLRPMGARTSYDMSAVPRAQRLTAAKLRPGDLMFWGTRGTRSKPAQNYHAGVYMGNGWFIHSSGGNGGAAIDRLDGYWGDHFSWGRRLLKAR